MGQRFKYKKMKVIEGNMNEYFIILEDAFLGWKNSEGFPKNCN